MSQRMQRIMVLCTNTISSMVFSIRPRLLLRDLACIGTNAVRPRFVLEMQLVLETRLLLEEIWYY